MSALFTIECRPPWLVARFPLRQRMVSWSLNRPGLIEAETVAWLQVCDADLPLGVDPLEMLERRLTEQGLDQALGLMTARDISFHHSATAIGQSVRVDALATLGLTNGVLMDGHGRLIDYTTTAPVGTINLLAAVSCPLSEGAMLEAMSVATMARTAALLADGGKIVGTGTDCVVIACPNDTPGEAFAGLHTDVGSQITTAVFQAVREARKVWEE